MFKMKGNAMKISSSLKSLPYLAAALLACLSAGTHAQDDIANYPNKPIRLIVPFGPGGAGDAVARLMADRLRPMLNNATILIENKPGAGGAIGTTELARAKPDGYTLLLAFDGNLVVSPTLVKSITFHPVRDFQPIAKLVNLPIMVVAHPSVKANNIKEFIDQSKVKPGDITYGTTGVGNTMHLAGELLRTRAGMAWTHVPYASGGAKTLTDLAGGFINSAILSVSVAGPMIRDGRLKGIGVFSDKRALLLPDVPTFQEAGIGGIEASSWLGLVAPAGTPRPLVDRLNKAANEVIRNPEAVARLQALALEPTPGSVDEFDAIIKSEFAKWTQVVKDANIKVE